MKWGIRRYQPYPNGKKGTYIGKKARYTKEENKTRKDLVRGVTAAQRNVIDKQRLMEDSVVKLNKAKADNLQARKMTVMPWNRDKKRQLVAETEEYLRQAMKELEIPKADEQRALEYCKKQTESLKSFAATMNKKYGQENIKQLKTKLSSVVYDDGTIYTNEFLKVGINMANFPIIGNWISANYVTDWENADRETLSKTRAENIRKNRY